MRWGVTLIDCAGFWGDWFSVWYSMFSLFLTSSKACHEVADKESRMSCCICMYVWCLYVCMYVCMYVYIYGCMEGWTNVYLYVCMHIFMYACPCMCVRERVCVWMCVCVCLCVLQCVLQCVTECCYVLQDCFPIHMHVAVYVAECVTACCSVLQRVAVYRVA